MEEVHSVFWKLCEVFLRVEEGAVLGNGGARRNRPLNEGCGRVEGLYFSAEERGGKITLVSLLLGFRIHLIKVIVVYAWKNRI